MMITMNKARAMTVALLALAMVFLTGCDPDVDETLGDDRGSVPVVREVVEGKGADARSDAQVLADVRSVCADFEAQGVKDTIVRRAYDPAVAGNYDEQAYLAALMVAAVNRECVNFLPEYNTAWAELEEEFH